MGEGGRCKPRERNGEKRKSLEDALCLVGYDEGSGVRRRDKGKSRGEKESERKGVLSQGGEGPSAEARKEMRQTA